MPIRPHSGAYRAQTRGNAVIPSQSRPAAPKGNNAGPQIVPIPGSQENTPQSLPTLNLDDKVASLPGPERKRLTLKPNVANARLIRLPAYPKSDWIPVESEAKIASK
jgi:hypothetical protein